MPTIKNTIDSYYQSQEANIINKVKEKDQILFHVKNQGCAAYRLISESLKLLDPFLNSKSTWLTIGDYNGLEANYLLQRNQNVTASDISDVLLAEAHKEGLIKEYSKQNVENITFDDNSFDYVVCKQAFHHFPRAYLGLYEMIRVSKNAVILLGEPVDILSRMASLMFIKNILDRIDPLLINKLWKNRFSFEEAGNYVFKISEREIEKIAMGIGLPFIAFKRYNTVIMHEPPQGLNDVPLNKKVYNKIQRELKFKNLISTLGILPYNTICCVLFKQQPDDFMIQRMEKSGFISIQLPANPYLK